MFEDVEWGVRVKASCVGREFSKPRLCQRFGSFQPASAHHVEASRRAPHRYSPMPPAVPESLWTEYTKSLTQARLEREEAWRSYRKSASRERQNLKERYRHQRHMLAALPVCRQDRKRLLKQLAQRQGIESRLLRKKLANRRRLIQKTPHPGNWRHFVARCAAWGDHRAIRLVQEREQERSGWDLGRGE